MPKYRGYITTLSKADWKLLLPEIEQYCKNYLDGWTKSYKLSFEEAFLLMKSLRFTMSLADVQEL